MYDHIYHLIEQAIASPQAVKACSGNLPIVFELCYNDKMRLIEPTLHQMTLAVYIIIILFALLVGLTILFFTLRLVKDMLISWHICSIADSNIEKLKENNNN